MNYGTLSWCCEGAWVEAYPHMGGLEVLKVEAFSWSAKRHQDSEFSTPCRIDLK